MENETRKKLMAETYNQLYGSDPEIWVRAPGRVDLMGSHTDYNMGYVMTMSISKDLWIAAGRLENEDTANTKIRMYSLNLRESAEIDSAILKKSSRNPWIDYPAGVAAVLLAEGYNIHGFQGVVHSTIPMDSGLSSSAAFEAAVLILFQEMGGYEIDPVRGARICQRAENTFVGMNCGILDQYSSILGEAGKTILLDCRNLTHETVPFPKDLTAVICNTNAPRQLTGSEYGERRAQCEEAAAVLGARFPQVGALRDADIGQLEDCKSEMSPISFKRGKFIIEENSRVLDLADAFRRQDLSAIQHLYAGSFTGARDLFEISVPAMEQMIEAMNSSPGIVGARQAGAGFGGCMIALVNTSDTALFSDSVMEKYKQFSGLAAEVYPVGADAGAGVLRFS